MLLLTCNENRNTPLSSPSGFIKIEIIILDIKESIDKNPCNLYEYDFIKVMLQTKIKRYRYIPWFFTSYIHRAMNTRTIYC